MTASAEAAVHWYGGPLAADRISDTLALGLLEPSDGWLAELPEEFTGRRVQLTTLAEARQGRRPVFAKPPSDKSFPAAVYADGSRLPRTGDGVGPDTAVLLSDVVTFAVEYRLFVLDGQVAAGSRYAVYGRLDPAPLDGDVREPERGAGDTDCSALPPLRFRHPTRLDMDLHHASPKQHCRGCARDNEGTVKSFPPPEQKCLLSVGDDTYELEDVHWHTPSEHTVGGVAFPLEQHMKYKREVAKGKFAYAVIAVFVHPGQANDSLDQLLSSARPAEHSKGSWEVPDVQLYTLLPTCTES